MINLNPTLDMSSRSYSHLASLIQSNRRQLSQLYFDIVHNLSGFMKYVKNMEKMEFNSSKSLKPKLHHSENLVHFQFLNLHGIGKNCMKLNKVKQKCFCC